MGSDRKYTQEMDITRKYEILQGKRSEHCSNKDYKIERAKGYGIVGSLQQKPVTTKTSFQAGRNNKSLNAIGILKLVMEEKLNLSNNINDYLLIKPNWLHYCLEYELRLV